MKAFPFFKNLGALLLLNVLIKPLWIFGVDRQVQNLVGHEAYGTYFSLLNLSLVFAFITDAGLSNMANRQLASGVPFPVRQLLQLKIGLAALYCVLVLATAWATGALQWHILLPVMAIQILLSFFSFFRSIITAHQLFSWDVWFSVIDKGLMLVLFLPMLYTQLFQKPITIRFFLQAQVFCTATAVAAAGLLLLKKHLLHTGAAPQKIVAVLKSTAPYAFIILTMAVHNRLDAFLLTRLHPNGAYEAGVYATAYRLLDAANMIGYLVASFLVPFLARHQRNRPLISETVLTARYGLLLFGVFAALFLVVFAVPVQHLLYAAATPYQAQVLQWCLPVLPAYLLLQVYGSLLTAFGQLKPFLLLLVVAVLFNSVLNGLLIPHFGAAGCCMAALASQYTIALGIYVYAVHKNGLPHDVRQWANLAAVTLLTGALFIVGRQYGVHPLLLALGGGGVMLLALFTYLPFFKRFFILSS